MSDKGICEKHGEFILREGCPDCIQEERERREAEALGEKIPVEEPAAETALAKAPGSDVEAMNYYTEALKLQEYAESRVIATVEDIKLATDDLSIISKLKKAMDNKRKSLLDPLKLQSDAIRETYNYLMTPVLEAGRITREKMLAYDAEVKRKRAEQEKINQLRIEAAQKEAALSGTGEITEQVGLVEVAPEPAKSVSTEMGSSGIVDHWKYEVTDFALLPDAYKVADSALLNDTARKHHDKKPVPGVRFYNEPYIASRAR